MKRYLIILLLLAIIGTIAFFGVKSIAQGFPSADVKVITTPTTVTFTGPVILDAIHNQSQLETVSMVLANDQDISKMWGVEGACQESLTYLGYFTVTAGVDLQQLNASDIILGGSGVPAETAVTLRLPPARILHVELDTQRSRVVHTDVSIISQLCGTQLPAMVLEAQSNLQKVAEKSAKDQQIIKLAQDRAAFELQKVLLTLGFSNVTVQFDEAYGDH